MTHLPFPQIPAAAADTETQQHRVAHPCRLQGKNILRRSSNALADASSIIYLGSSENKATWRDACIGF